MPTWLHKRLRREEGFTLIELLVVILIIGILAAIAIPAFLSQKGKGEDAAAKSSVRQAQTAMETYYTDNSNYTCGTTVAGGGCDLALHAIEPTLPVFSVVANQPSMSVSDSGGSGAPTTNYRVTVVSAPSGRTFSIDKSGGVITRPCFVPTGQSQGGCTKNLAAGTGGQNGTW